MREVFINVADFDIYLVGRLSKGEQEGGGGRFFRRFRSLIIFTIVYI